MPAARADQRQQVKMLVQSLGCTETAKQTGIPLNTILSWSARFKWIKALKEPPALPPTVQNASAIAAITPAQVLENTLLDDSRQTRANLSRYARKVSSHVAELPDKQALKASRAVKDVAAVADTVHGWSSDRDRGLQVNILSIGGNTQIGI